jgi:hypothetical protein
MVDYYNFMGKDRLQIGIFLIVQNEQEQKCYGYISTINTSAMLC